MARRQGSLKCPKCGQRGFLSKRWVRSSYYPKYASVSCKRLEEQLAKLKQNPQDAYYKEQVEYWRAQVKGVRYRRDEAKESFNREACYRVFTQKYVKYYVGHYDKEKYAEQMKQFAEKKRKSKPNGRRWCGPINFLPTSLI